MHVKGTVTYRKVNFEGFLSLYVGIREGIECVRSRAHSEST